MSRPLPPRGAPPRYDPQNDHYYNTDAFSASFRSQQPAQRSSPFTSDFSQQRQARRSNEFTSDFSQQQYARRSNRFTSDFDLQQHARRSEYTYRRDTPDSSALAMDDYPEDDYEDLSYYSDDGTDDYYENNPRQIPYYVRSRMLPCCDECLVERVGIFNDILDEYDYEYGVLLDVFDEESELHENTTADNHVVNRRTDEGVYGTHYPERRDFARRYPNRERPPRQSASSDAFRDSFDQPRARSYEQRREVYTAQQPAPNSQLPVPTASRDEAFGSRPSRRRPRTSRGRGRGRGRGHSGNQPQYVAPLPPAGPAGPALAPAPAPPAVSTNQPAVKPNSPQDQPGPNNRPQNQPGRQGAQRTTGMPTFGNCFTSTPSTLAQRQLVWDNTRGADCESFPGCEPFVIRLPSVDFDWWACFGSQLNISRAVQDVHPKIKPVVRQARDSPHGREIVLGMCNPRDWNNPRAQFNLNQAYDMMLSYCETLVKENKNIPYSQNTGDQCIEYMRNANMDYIVGMTESIKSHIKSSDKRREAQKDAAAKFVLPLIQQYPSANNSIRDEICNWAESQQKDECLIGLSKDELLQLGRAVWWDYSFETKEKGHSIREYINVSYPGHSYATKIKS
ncbi:hypothetical protein F5Y00DRAFT_274588 [Daldinia vernicosa]|uniref:uncharacterized protein n=1 Tax=Daldinia vernicosa TaxID=114800 RepID=UPI002007B355|nr:uncharacterized protein F5Y00DRAFT_274588 [Daldinia vernicosa]KAI0851681.1 hypothetical protein F5Y00DRAFT_274588 [Daldinia vernicosa]